MSAEGGASGGVAFEVLATGPLALLQDAGRPGYAHLGVTGSGAADRGAYEAANRLVGNEPGAAALEIVFGGLELRARRTVLVALTGAPAVATVTEFTRAGRHSAITAASSGVDDASPPRAPWTDGTTQSAPRTGGAAPPAPRTDGTTPPGRRTDGATLPGRRTDGATLPGRTDGAALPGRRTDGATQPGRRTDGATPPAPRTDGAMPPAPWRDDAAKPDAGPGATRIRRTVLHPGGTSFTVFAGDTITVGAPVEGLRSYLALRGGFAGERVLGSRSSDVLSGLGPAALRPGDELELAGDEHGTAGEWPGATLIPPPLPRTGAAALALTRGPRDDWFGDAGWRALLETAWIVGTDSNRVGVRLAGTDGAAVVRAPDRAGELPSEGMVVGAVQIPPSGQPVVFHRDHPVTGGYPVIGVLTEAALDLAAQLWPGDPVRFRSV